MSQEEVASSLEELGMNEKDLIKFNESHSKKQSDKEKIILLTFRKKFYLNYI